MLNCSFTTSKKPALGQKFYSFSFHYLLVCCFIDFLTSLWTWLTCNFVPPPPPCQHKSTLTNMEINLFFYYASGYITLSTPDTSGLMRQKTWMRQNATQQIPDSKLIPRSIFFFCNPNACTTFHTKDKSICNVSFVLSSVDSLKLLVA